MCTNGGINTYHDITPEQQRKIEGLLETKQLPKTFNLNGKMVIRDDILGFTNDKAQTTLGISNWEEFRQWAYRQDWYRKGKSNPLASSKPQTIDLQL